MSMYNMYACVDVSMHVSCRRQVTHTFCKCEQRHRPQHAAIGTIKYNPIIANAPGLGVYVPFTPSYVSRGCFYKAGK